MTSSSRRRILIAEDNENARLILTDLCRIFGYEVVAVEHGLAAVEAAAEGSYDVILMDCHMPVLDGFDATRRIRSTEAGRRPVIIAVTGDGNSTDCMAAGMDDYLSKPVRPPLLRAALNRWLDHSNRASAAAPAGGAIVDG